jgi:hypothetical protein
MTEEISMATEVRGAKYAQYALNTRDQSIDHVQQLVKHLAQAAGCSGCGRIALLRADFLSDPTEEEAKLGVTSVMSQGLG